MIENCGEKNSQSRVLIAVPTYNERDNVNELCNRLVKAMPSAEIVFIDDGSPDGTAQEVQRFCILFTNISLIVRESKDGIGSAHKVALEEAHRRRSDVLVTLDADLTHNPEDIPRLLQCLDSADVVVSSRFKSGGGLEDWPTWRKVLTSLGHFATQLFLLVPYDSTSALRAYRVGDFTNLILKMGLSDSYSFFYQSLACLVRVKARVGEVPVVLPARAFGSSKMKKRDIFFGVVGLVWFAITHRSRVRRTYHKSEGNQK